MSPWAKFYTGRDNASYLAYAKERYRPFISAVASHILPGDFVLELGAGVGTITKALVDMASWPSDIAFAATDTDKDQLERLARRFEGSHVLTSQLDAKALECCADVVHSHGMLEHFNDDDIRQVIDAHRDARAQVHYVPGLYERPTFGDERLMSVDQWWKICKPSEIITFNEGLDYALVFE